MKKMFNITNHQGEIPAKAREISSHSSSRMYQEDRKKSSQWKMKGRYNVYCWYRNVIFVLAERYGFPQKLKMFGTTIISLSTADICIQKEGNLYREEYPAHVCTTFLHNSQDTESSNGWTGKRRKYEFYTQWVFSHKKQILSFHRIRNWGHYVEVNKPGTEDKVSFSLTYVKD